MELTFNKIYLIIMNIIINTAFIIGMISCCQIIFTRKLKNLENNFHKYLLLSIFIYILYIPLLISKDTSSWAMVFGAFVLTNAFRNVYTKVSK